MSGGDSPTFFHGQPWSSWIEKIGRDRPLSDDEQNNEPASSVMRLGVDDVDLYGFCPERDDFYGVVCEVCNSVVKPQALTQHMESRHPSGASNLPPPTNSSTKLLLKTPYCKLSKLKKSQSSGQLSLTNNGSGGGGGGSGNGASSKTSNNHVPVKQRTAGGDGSQPQQPGLHPGSSPRSPLDGGGLGIGNSGGGGGGLNNGGSANPPAGQLGGAAAAAAATPGVFANALGAVASAASPVKSPGNQPKRKRLKTERLLLKDREYDPDRHCGVWNEETGKPCTRSLTCKAHTVSLRRTVAGRSKSFDKLLAEHRASKESPASRNAAGGAGSAKAVAASSGGGSSSSVPVVASSSSTNSANNGSVAPAAPAVVAVSIAASAIAAEPASASGAPLLAAHVVDAAAVVPSSTSLPDLEAPSSPPVLSLPDTHPLPQAVDLLYRCLAPHGSNKPTKLEEDFANELDAGRRVDSSLVSNSVAAAITNSVGGMNSSSNGSGAAAAPVSVALPSLSPIQSAGGLSPGQAASLLHYNRASSSPLGLEQLVAKQQQQQQQQQQSPVSVPIVSSSASGLLLGSGSQASAPAAGTFVLEAKPAPMDLDPPVPALYMSPVHQYKDGLAAKLSARSSQSPSSRSSSFSSLFDSSAASLLQLDHQQHLQQLDASMRNSHFAASLLTNGGKQQPQQQQQHQQQRVGSSSNHVNYQSLGRGLKSEYGQDYSTAIQLEATAASAPYIATSFEDITWSSHHPEPLAVSKWLRVNSSRKQYNFNIH